MKKPTLDELTYRVAKHIMGWNVPTPEMLIHDYCDIGVLPSEALVRGNVSIGDFTCNFYVIMEANSQGIYWKPFHREASARYVLDRMRELGYTLEIFYSGVKSTVVVYKDGKHVYTESNKSTAKAITMAALGTMGLL